MVGDVSLKAPNRHDEVFKIALWSPRIRGVRPWLRPRTAFRPGRRCVGRQRAYCEGPPSYISHLYCDMVVYVSLLQEGRVVATYVLVANRSVFLDGCYVNPAGNIAVRDKLLLVPCLLLHGCSIDCRCASRESNFISPLRESALHRACRGGSNLRSGCERFYAVLAHFQKQKWRFFLSRVSQARGCLCSY